jgi:hypothetical protein
MKLTQKQQPQRVLTQYKPPMVLSWYSWNWPFTNRSTRLDLPTLDSPKHQRVKKRRSKDQKEKASSKEKEEKIECK